MVYKYQKETFNYLSEVVERLEKITDSKMSLKIGYIRENYHLGNGEFTKAKGDLYLTIHNGNNFKMVGTFENGFDVTDDFDIIDSEAYVRLDKNLFIKLNEWIDKIYSNKRDLEQFHDRLNKELCALNKAL